MAGTMQNKQRMSRYGKFVWPDIEKTIETLPAGRSYFDC